MGEDIFCKLYSKWKTQGKIIYENEHVYSILSVTPAMPLHSTIITKRHLEEEEDISPIEAKAIFSAIKGTFEAVKRMNRGEIKKFYEELKQFPPTEESKALAELMLASERLFDKPIAYNVGINHGKEAGQIVNHYHLHLFPATKAGKGIVTAMREFLIRP